MAGETVILLWGLFDDEMVLEFEGEKFGPYYPVSGPIPLHRYHAFKRGKSEARAERIRALADQLALPISALSGDDIRMVPPVAMAELPKQPFETPLPEYQFPSAIAAKLAIADDLATDKKVQIPKGETSIDSILTPDAIDQLATRLRTPLQIQLHLALALEAGYQTGETPISTELIESVLSHQLDDLEPTLARHDYLLKDLVEQFDVKPAEIKSLFSNNLDATRASELRSQFLAAGLPI